MSILNGPQVELTIDLGWRHDRGAAVSTLFAEPIVATDRGITVETDGIPADQPDGEGPLNTIGYVVERYGSLSPAGLRALIIASKPWQLATLTGGHVNVGALRDWFLRDDETDDPDDERPNRAERAATAEIWEKHKAEQMSAGVRR